MIRTVEIEDDLEERIQNVLDELKARVVTFKEEQDNVIGINEEQTLEAFKEWLEYDGQINEIVDSATPISNKRIDDLFYLYGDEFIEAYSDAGIYGSNETPDNFKQVCIYLYIEQEVYRRFDDEIGPLLER